MLKNEKTIIICSLKIKQNHDKNRVICKIHNLIFVLDILVKNLLSKRPPSNRIFSSFISES